MPWSIVEAPYDQLISSTDQYKSALLHQDLRGKLASLYTLRPRNQENYSQPLMYAHRRNMKCLMMTTLLVRVPSRQPPSALTTVLWTYQHTTSVIPSLLPRHEPVSFAWHGDPEHSPRPLFEDRKLSLQSHFRIYFKAWPVFEATIGRTP